MPRPRVLSETVLCAIVGLGAGLLLSACSPHNNAPDNLPPVSPPSTHAPQPGSPSQPPEPTAPASRQAISNEQAKQVQLGMSKEDVLHLIGYPNDMPSSVSVNDALDDSDKDFIYKTDSNAVFLVGFNKRRVWSAMLGTDGSTLWSIEGQKPPDDFPIPP